MQQTESYTVRVEASKSYDVIVRRGILKESGEYVRSVSKAQTAVLVCGDIVEKLYADTVAASLENAGFRVLRFVLPHGEHSKNAVELFRLLEFMAENAVTRSDIIVALGGGVTGDLSGFAAAVFLRGIDYVQIPTTLLSAVDSSVGGKTAVDLAAGKNLAGAFKQPSIVLCDPDTLSTLPPEEFASGMGEVIKYGLLCDKELFELLENADSNADIEKIIARCVAIKRDVVAADEFDTGARQTLNLGHTLAHAIEKCSSFTVKHGHAVAIGIVRICRCAHKAGLAEEDFSARVAAVCEKYSLPTATSYDNAEMCREILKDKKRSGGSITLVVPRSIGDTILYKLPVEKLEEFYSE